MTDLKLALESYKQILIAENIPQPAFNLMQIAYLTGVGVGLAIAEKAFTKTNAEIFSGHEEVVEALEKLNGEKPKLADRVLRVVKH